MTKKTSSKKNPSSQKRKATKSKAMKKSSVSDSKSKKRVPSATKANASGKTRTRPTQFASALKAYEAGLKLMGANEFKQAIAKFESLLEQYQTETEILDRVHVLLKACRTRIEMNRHAKAKLKTPDDFYEVGILIMCITR